MYGFETGPGAAVAAAVVTVVTGPGFVCAEGVGGTVGLEVGRESLSIGVVKSKSDAVVVTAAAACGGAEEVRDWAKGGSRGRGEGLLAVAGAGEGLVDGEGAGAWEVRGAADAAGEGELSAHGSAATDDAGGVQGGRSEASGCCRDVEGDWGSWGCVREGLGPDEVGECGDAVAAVHNRC